MRMTLNSLYPDGSLSVPLPSPLEDHDFYKEGTRKVQPIPYQEDETAFVREALRVFNGSALAFVRWPQTTTMTSLLTDKIDLMTELYLGSKLGLSKAEHPVRIEEVLQETLKVAQLLALNSKDKEMLSWLGLQRNFFTSTAPAYKHFFDQKTGRPLPLLDRVLNLISDTNELLKEAKDYYITQRDIGTFLFPPEADLDRTLKAQFLPPVLNTFKMTDEVITAVHALERTVRTEDLKIPFSFDPITGREETILDQLTAAGLPLLVTPQKIQDLENKRHDFLKKDTRGFYE